MAWMAGRHRDSYPSDPSGQPNQSSAVEREGDTALHTVVIGGGIGGLSAALALQRAGVRVTIFERQPQLREIGSGLTLWSNAVRQLRRLGLFDALRAGSAPLERFEFWSWRGERLGTIPLGSLAETLGAPSVGVHRADLLALLARAITDCPVELDAQCVGFSQDGEVVTAHFADGRTATGDLLIGADGLHSAVRAQLLGQRPPRYAGYTCWRGVTTFEHAAVSPGITSETLGYGTRFGMLPIGRGRVFWYATANAGEGDDPRAERKHAVLDLFQRFRSPIASVIEATDEAAILRHDIYDRPPVPRWGTGRATLLGDAAHPPTPNQGQGACQAIEDAVVLARCLRDAREDEAVVSALRRYEQLRQGRTARIIRQSRRIGEALQWRNPITCTLRDMALRATTATVVAAQFRALLAYEA
jgi:2-polyprenyl-6-methoxyphenol hydroxylase-like FAD-dependent oxidoreductase